ERRLIWKTSTSSVSRTRKRIRRTDMFWTFFWFEIKLRFRSISTYIFFLIPFGMLFFAVSSADFGPVPPGKILLNGPWALLQNFVQITGFGSILIAAIFGPTIL